MDKVYQRFEFLPQRKTALELRAAHVVEMGEGKPERSNVGRFPGSVISGERE